MRLEAAPAERLTRTAYNLSAFAPTAQDVHDAVLAAFPAAALSWRVDEKRQAIVDSWPADVDDSAARRDWGFAPAFDFVARSATISFPRSGSATDDRAAARVSLRAGLLVAVAGALGCGTPTDRAPTQTAPPAAGGPESMQVLATQYVSLVLAVGQHDPDYVDAYYGPPEWRAAAVKRPLADIDARCRRAGWPARAADASVRGRRSDRRAAPPLSLPAARGAARAGGDAAADASCRSTRSRRRSTTPWRRITTARSSRPSWPSSTRLLPGRGPLLDRYTRFRDAYVIRPARLDATFKAAIDGCRQPDARTRAGCRPARASPSSTSPTRAGAATTGIRAAIAA